MRRRRRDGRNGRRPRHLNAAGTVQGGALFTLADFAFAVAANAGGVLTVSLQNSISFLRAAKPARLTARAEPGERNPPHLLL